LILYLETSALLKLYVAEPEAERVHKAVRSAAAISTHLIAYAEVRSAFSKALRMNRINAEGLRRHQRELDADWENFMVLQVDERLVRRAGELIDHYSLRAYDSVHLAAAESLTGGRDAARLTFLSFDIDLVRAAADLGMTVAQQ
jgi:uncharacterized protein